MKSSRVAGTVTCQARRRASAGCPSMDPWGCGTTRGVWGCSGVLRHIRDIQRHSGMLRDAQEHSEILRDAQRFSGMLRHIQGCSGTSMDIQECSEMLRDIQEFSRMLRDAQGCHIFLQIRESKQLSGCCSSSPVISQARHPLQVCPGLPSTSGSIGALSTDNSR